jgi:hypothetical protein
MRETWGQSRFGGVECPKRQYSAMIFGLDNELWKHHNLRPGDMCPFCGALLMLRRERSLWTLFRVRLWVRCSHETCNFAVPVTEEKVADSG